MILGSNGVPLQWNDFWVPFAMYIVSVFMRTKLITIAINIPFQLLSRKPNTDDGLMDIVVVGLQNMNVQFILKFILFD